ncbi:unnamed protein product [Cylindrotheca closterium]|uniref:Uncharacterized protein n=1 Tax=Cylindrotheca closterium TaxID=2856 RepID=A0AAD2CDI2_9STRA|nr:unnamed protein product [Cylindrotheca closterium]
MSTYLNTGPPRSKSSPRLAKADSLDEKYTKRRKQEFVAEYRQQQLQQRQLLTFGGVITFLFLFVLVFYWELPSSTDIPGRTPADISRNIKRRRNHLRDGSGDSADRRNPLGASMDDDSDDDDIAVVAAKPIDNENLNKRMAQTIEDLKRFQQEKDLLHQQQLQQHEKNNPNVHNSNQG